MRVIPGIEFRQAAVADVPAMLSCHRTDPVNSTPDNRIAAYFDREHHPQQALPARIGYVALSKDQIVGYIAGHRTTRHGCAGEVQYLFVASEYRRRGIATRLLEMLAEWFTAEDAARVCVALAGDSPIEAQPFYEHAEARPLKRFWYGWEDISVVLR
jgi:GNAT superfamily N-acetyltransferase